MRSGEDSPLTEFRRTMGQMCKELVRAIEHAVADGASDFVGKEMSVVAREEDSEESFLVTVIVHPRKSSLTPRETEVVRLIGCGLGNRGIGNRLGVSTKTVQKHIERAKIKWAVSTRAQIARHAAFLPMEEVQTTV